MNHFHEVEEWFRNTSMFLKPRNPETIFIHETQAGFSGRGIPEVPGFDRCNSSGSTCAEWKRQRLFQRKTVSFDQHWTSIRVTAASWSGLTNTASGFSLLVLCLNYFGKAEFLQGNLPRTCQIFTQMDPKLIHVTKVDTCYRHNLNGILQAHSNYMSLFKMLQCYITSIIWKEAMDNVDLKWW